MRLRDRYIQMGRLMSKYGSKTIFQCVDRIFNGESMKSVSIDKGIPVETIRYWCKTHGVKPTRSAWSETERRIAKRMSSKGFSCGQIARKVGRTPVAVKIFAQRNRDIMPSRGHGGKRVGSGRKSTR